MPNPHDDADDADLLLHQLLQIVVNRERILAAHALKRGDSLLSRSIGVF